MKSLACIQRHFRAAMKNALPFQNSQELHYLNEPTRRFY